MLSGLPEHGRVLEIGCGSGRILNTIAVHRPGLSLHGCDIRPLRYEPTAVGSLEAVIAPPYDVIDDDLPTGREFMAEYKKRVGPLAYVSVPYRAFYAFCYLWERHCRWSEGQFPLAFNRRRCSAYWKGNRYSNQKLKKLTGWRPRVSFEAAAPDYFAYLKGNRTAQC